MHAADPDALLPSRLRRRSRLINPHAMRSQGDFVLLWAHHVLREHDNPALDAALHLAHALDKPVLVYQGLGGNHRYNADRHLAFILQGARDFHQALARRGIRHVTHLPGWTAGDGLGALLPRVAALVCEDYPAPPFPRWAQRWAERCPAACIAVDAACIVPMAASAKRHERAFTYRKAMLACFERELGETMEAPAAISWPEHLAPVVPGIDWARFDLSAALARCAIDHSLPPVADTVGGSQAGYARWERFKQSGLTRYHQLRNDAAITPPLGVSRMSPYLHYGMVSPWRLAREAREVGGPGAEKFLDELWVWRELAWQWCWHTADPESPQALPDWARASFAEHAQDPRRQPCEESLHRARSGEPLWDLAQSSLLRHGELHNNLRMTWGKALVGWSSSFGMAMNRLRELNHRFALDGNDPASYGGLWWCLGLFDRPFDPPQPVFGRLRTRPIDRHAQRLDLQRYAAHVQRGASRLPRVAIIGAGMAGAAAAQALVDQGYAVCVLDKSRGVGGRLSTRRSELGPFDHGAQFIRAHDARFRRQLARWAEAGYLQRWHPRTGAADPLGAAWVPTGSMNALLKPMLEGASVLLGSAVSALQRDGSGWRLLDEQGSLLAEAEQLIITAPAPQASALLATVAPQLADRLDSVRYAPCWAAMLALQDPVNVDLLRDCGPISWAAADASRPGRPPGHRWVAQASAEWSRAHLESTPQAAGQALGEALSKALGVEVTLASAHRWRYALVEQPLGIDCLAEPSLGLRVAGDGCLGGRVEAAFLSGQAAAGCLMREQALSAQLIGAS